MYKDLHYVIPSGYNVDFENNTKNTLCGQNYLLPTRGGGGKGVPVQAWTGAEISGSQISSKVVSLYSRGNILGDHFC